MVLSIFENHNSATRDMFMERKIDRRTVDGAGSIEDIIVTLS
jgi:hypothetical protein